MQELPYIPEPHRPTEIVIKVDCPTVSLQDCMIRRGKWYDMQKLPFTPGSDFIGTIHEIGSEASRCSTFKVGDRVAALVPSYCGLSNGILLAPGANVASAGFALL